MKKNKNGLIVPDSTEALPCKILHAKLDCQKTPKETDVRELASNWEDKLCDPIHVSYRDTTSLSPMVTHWYRAATPASWRR